MLFRSLHRPTLIPTPLFGLKAVYGAELVETLLGSQRVSSEKLRASGFEFAHPELEVLLSTTDRRVDVLRDGFDCVLRVGALKDSGLASRRLGLMPMLNCASPGYLRRNGTPRSLADLDAHWVVHYSLEFGADAPSFEYRAGAGYLERPTRQR